MYTKTDKEKIEKICQMIFEVANGNFSYRIERSKHDDLLESIVLSLNMMGEEIREIFNHFAYVNPHETYKHVAQMTFILDEEYKILNFNAPAQELLGLEASEINRKYFEEFLTRESQKLWENETAEMIKSGDTPFFHTVRLFFSSSNSLTVPALCSVSSLLLKKNKKKLYFVTAFQTIIKSEEKEEEIQTVLQNLKQKRLKRKKKEQALIYREKDKRKIQEIYDYILHNLDKPLPSLRELALDHGINEFKLKVGFRQLYDTTVFRFQKDQRLKQAHNYIINSELPLGRIADLCGFKSLAHFSKIFKQKYGYNPSELKNQNLG